MRPIAPVPFSTTSREKTASPEKTASRRRRGESVLGSQLLRAAALILASGALGGCTGPQTPQGKATEAARELNEAARWGRMEVAISRTDPDNQSEFMKRRASWHGSLRILETELAGLRLTDPTNAVVQVDVSWTMADDTTLRTTRLEQKWSDDEGKWVLVDEKRIAGAKGLFGEEVDRGEPRPDRHFPTRVIH